MIRSDTKLIGKIAGYPNYPTLEKIITNVNGSYTIKKDGFVRVFSQAGGNGTFAAYLKINDKGVYNICIINNVVTGSEFSSQFFPVKAGDVVEQYGVTNLGQYSAVWFCEKQ